MRALLLSNLQNDFCQGGALGIDTSRQVILIANALMPGFDCVAAIIEWHPANHVSFAANHLWRKPGQTIEINGYPQKLWVMHCVQDSFGAEWCDLLQQNAIQKTVVTGTNPQVEAYSGFFDVDKSQSTGLHEFLLEKEVKEVYLLGFTTGYAIKNTALDAIELGYKTFVIMDGCADFDESQHVPEKTIEELKALGVRMIESTDLLNP